jgi:hypothetical protein
MRSIAAPVLFALTIAACGRASQPDTVDLDLIHVGEAKLRTDSVGGDPLPASLGLPAGCKDISQADRRPRDPRLRELCDQVNELLDDRQWALPATFVLVDAGNDSDTGAYITLAGTLRDASGAALDELKPESLWVPAHAERTFALVDAAHVARPTAAGAQIRVRGARAGSPPIMHVEEVRTVDDYGKVVAQAKLVNDADHAGRAIVMAAFADADHRPMARPFSFVEVGGGAHTYVQLVGPKGSKTATVYVGETVY